MRIFFFPNYYKTHKIYFKTSIRTYTGILRINTFKNTFELDIYIGEPHWEDGTQKFIGECQWIGGWEDEPLKNPKQVRECARETIEEYELPERTANYFQLRNFFIDLRENEDKEMPRYKEPERPEIYDHEEKDHMNYIKYLMDHPHELDSLDREERNQLLKENVELRLRYHEWKALRAKGGAG